METVLQEAGDPHASRVELTNSLCQYEIWVLVSVVDDDPNTRFSQGTLPSSRASLFLAWIAWIRSGYTLVCVAPIRIEAKRLLRARISRCAQTARFTSGGRYHPASCRLSW